MLTADPAFAKFLDKLLPEAAAEAWQQGFEVGLAARDLTTYQDNPYPPETLSAQRWECGWLKGYCETP